jgi:selenocysteine-specific elongation factor
VRALAPLEARLVGGAGGRRYVGETARADAMARVEHAIAEHHRVHPDDEAAPLTVAYGALPDDAAPGLADLAIDALVRRGAIVRVGERLRAATFAPQVRVDDPIAARIVDALATHALTPPSLTEIATTLGLSVARARALAQALEKAGRVTHVKEDLWMHRAAIDDLVARVVARFATHESMTTGELKELVGASRKYVVPLAEWLDGQRITLRVGDLRKLRRR